MLTVVEKVLLLAEVDILADTSSEDLAILATASRVQDLDAGEIVYEAGDGADAAYVIVDGSVKLLNATGAHLVLSRGAFGTWALLDGAPRTFTATAVETTRLLELTREAFADVIADHGRVAQAMLRRLAGRVRREVLARHETELTGDHVSLG